MTDFASAQLAPFSQSSAATTLSWVTSPTDLFHWAARDDFPLTDTSVFEKWHADSDVQSYQLMVDNALHGYGEIWHDQDDGSRELARLLIAPSSRNEGLGQLLIDLLIHEISQPNPQIWVRVLPSNRPAIGCYQRAGFVRAPREKELHFNTSQPHDYVWMSRQPEN